MAKYLDTSQISSELMQLLKEAKEKIILVTFSLQVNTQIQERLKTKSKLGTLSEITLIYGNTKLKDSELNWMEEIDDLRVFQKKNLHAKCYVNEKKAIISSMNLYDYSQSTNIEMGFLITKEEEPEAYEKMMEDIADLKINGDRKKINELVEIKAGKQERKAVKPSIPTRPSKSKLSYSQQVKKFLLEELRDELSAVFKRNSHSILSDQSISEIIQKDNLSYYHLNQVLKNDKKVKELGGDILNAISQEENYTIGRITGTRYQNDEFSYDQIQMTTLADNHSQWYHTKKELPRKNQIVAVSLNKEWFNDYLILDESEVQYSKVDQKISRDYSNSKYKTTKELSQLVGISSREINSTLVTLGVMEKRGDDWHATNKGERYGGVQKEGQYGKFIVWPEEIVSDLELR